MKICPRIPEESRSHAAISNIAREKQEGGSRSQMATENIKNANMGGIMGTPTGDQDVPQSAFDQNPVSIARGCASVSFDVIRIPFFGEWGNLRLVFAIFVCVAGRPPGLAVGLGYVSDWQPVLVGL